MEITAITNTLHGMAASLTQKGYKGVNNYFDIDEMARTFSLRMSFQDEYGHSETVRAKITDEYGAEQTWNISILDFDAALANMQTAVNNVPQWEDVKKERAIATLKEAVNEVADLDDDMLSADEMEIIALIRQSMETLASNALTDQSAA